MKYSTGNCGDLNIVLALQEGIYIELPDTVTPMTVSGFICHLLNIDAETVAAEMKTIMVNNQVVDAPGKKRLYGGDTLTLSGAMPGLVGAMLRSDSPIGVMRAGITADTGDREVSTVSRVPNGPQGARLVPAFGHSVQVRATNALLLQVRQQC